MSVYITTNDWLHLLTNQKQDKWRRPGFGVPRSSFSCSALKPLLY